MQTKIQKQINIAIYKHTYKINYNQNKVSLKAMEQFPSLKEDGPTQPHHDIDHASASKEFTH